MMRYRIFLLSFLFVSGCGGGGSETDTSAVKSASVSTFAVNTQQTTPACTNPHKADYPESYNGSYRFTASNRKLESSVIRSIGLKDYYPGGEGPGGPHVYSNMCQPYEYAKMLYRNSLDKLKANGTDVVWVYNYASWDDSRNAVMKIDKKMQQIPDIMVEYLVQEAHKRGLKVYYSWFFDPKDVLGNEIYSFGKPVDIATLTKMLDSYHNLMIDISKYAQSIGIDGLTADWGFPSLSTVAENPEQIELWDKKMSLTIDEIRKNFSGKITYGASGIGIDWFNPAILNKVDYVQLPVWFQANTYTKENVSTANADSLEAMASCSIRYSYMLFVNRKKAYTTCPLEIEPTSVKLPSVIWGINFQSHGKALTDGFIEDGFCTPGKTDAGITHPCIQEITPIDFSKQAMAIEALLRAIDKQNLFMTAGVEFSTMYWHTDEVYPEPKRGFPNISQSIRNKPAEQVVKTWFAR